MLYAKFMRPNSGHNGDIEYAKKADLKAGEKYEVEYLSMGQSHTSVYLKSIEGCFNSVQFDFEEKGRPVDIYSSPKYNPYL